MDSSLSNTIDAVDVNAQYDQCAKKLLAHKRVLAHILVKTVNEFKGMKVDDVIPLIEGEPLIGRVYVDPGITNAVVEKGGEKIIGFNTEESEVNEGLIRYDIIFYVLTKNGRSRIIINIEAQKSEPDEYDINNRAIFYSCRMISSQKGKEFEKSNYDGIKKTYSIWIVMNQEVSSMNHIHLIDEPIIGNVSWKGNLDLLNIVFLGIPQKIPEYDENYDLHRLLGTLFSDSIGSEEKIERLKVEYSFPLEDSFEEVVKNMCNLSYGIEERGIEKGIEIGIEKGIEKGREEGIEKGREEGIEKGKIELIESMLRKGYKPELISEMTDLSIEKIRKISEDLMLAV